MARSKVYILGGAQTDFAKNWSRNNQGIDDIMKASFEQALAQCSLKPTEIDSIHIGNFVGELFCGQGQLGGVLLQHFPELNGTPSSRHEAACASGSMATFAGMREIEAGIYDIVAITGVELMRNVNGTIASKHLGAAAWVDYEAQEAMYPWVYLFAQIRDEYQERYGVQDEHLAQIAHLNYANAKRNPNAQTRDWDITDKDFLSDDEYNPIVEGSLRKSDCGRISDGSATIILASETYTKQYAKERNIKLSEIPYIKGWGHSSAPIKLETKLSTADQSGYLFPQLQKAISDALNRANIGDVNTLDALETHDCFTISEYIALEHFGLSQPGEAWKLIENDHIAFNGALPVNPSGGIIGSGHPVGATGVRMLLDGYKQVSGTAGDYQVEGAQNVGLLNIGGSFTTVASFVIGKS